MGPATSPWRIKTRPRAYPLTQLTKNKAVFEAPDKSLNLNYIPTGLRTMTIILRDKNKQGGLDEEVFDYTLK